MCLALPTQVLSRTGDLAIVDLGGVRKEISVALTPEAQPGDYVIVHVGYAIGLLDPEEARRTLEMFAADPELQAALSAAAANEITS
jgi:hydrogenase expression/formation protein HypC